MTSADLIAAVRERLDETEAAVRDVERIGLDRLLPGALIDSTGATVFFTQPVYERLIGYFDPAAVLRLVAGLREILAEHRPYEMGGDWYCSSCGDVPQVEFPCTTLLALARGLGIDPEET